MRIGFDLNTGNRIEEVELPEKTSFLFAPQKMLVAGQSKLSFNWDDTKLTNASLQVELSSKDLQRLAKEHVAGLTKAPELDENVYLQVELEADAKALSAHREEIKQARDAESLLHIEEDSYPLFLNLSNFQVRHMVQVNQKIEEVQ